MKNLDLNKQEKKELEKRGFLVKETFDLKDLFKSIFKIFIYLGLAGILLIPIGFFILLIDWISNVSGLEVINTVGAITILCGSLFILAFPILNFIYSYFQSGRIFITEHGSIEYGEIGKKITKKAKYLFLINNLITKLINSGTGGIGGSIYGLIMFFSCIIMVGSKTGNLEYMFSLFLSFITFLIIGRYTFQKLHPLYAFGNLGEKIQKLTLQIEEQSKNIQSEFQSDMNFSVLSDGFDSLSGTFSRIIALVLKLEKTEARANKGNLFDSEKYINSLRSDIVEPLESLKEFLQNQKTKLLSSQKELTRVRVGGSESTGNIELQSKRSEPLIQELTENIEKLDVMIGKMG